MLGIYTKHYNKWYLCDIGRQAWKKDGKNANYLVYAQMLTYDNAFNNYKGLTSFESDYWTNKSIFVLCEPDKIINILGKFERQVL